MKRTLFALVSCLLLGTAHLNAQHVKLTYNTLDPVQVSMSFEKVQGRQAVRVVKDSTVKEFDEPTFVRVKGIDFANGTIEVKVLSRLLPTAPDFARGFIGIAFRIDERNSTYESMYLRPTNARADDQVRRNHSIQYYAYPDFKFDRLRKEAPEAYESYADMALNEWITLKIVVKGKQAQLYLNGNKQPSLVVHDLKQQADASGAIGLWVDVGTEGYFSDLKITRNN
ncbi:hypothetical protein GCM10027275_10050 [Rhabdobacter roseus]|uniref:3-keto-alpha-glucoside-1,2-lyase/3-keto-2-hydroxy-glucal hydratase domain-containing protein n=1 Tax=Rhabdobacter roseus TaxID=1655419 RepID=A0A840TTA7_9BACT|nr:family 16 glycoside hydrolase [Rhabdobacter roseus]MBB5282909.1 hypothetical protein [Rhabdobacter roseus]